MDVDEGVRDRMEELQRENARLVAEVVRLRERRETAAQFVEAARRRGSIGSCSAEVLLRDLRDAPPATPGGA